MRTIVEVALVVVLVVVMLTHPRHTTINLYDCQGNTLGGAEVHK